MVEALGWTLVAVGAVLVFAVQLLIMRNNPDTPLRGAPLRPDPAFTWPERLLLLVPLASWVVGMQLLRHQGWGLGVVAFALGLLTLAAWGPRLARNLWRRRRTATTPDQNSPS